jgi:AbiV family abortive infection protein
MPPEKQREILNALRVGAEKSFLNAEQLFKEASILAEHGAVCRAYFLHQISLEECAKVDILTSTSFSVTAGIEIDFARVKKIISSHSHKNRANAFYLERTEEELAAETTSDAATAFAKLQKAFHQKSNDAKNSGLYVNLVGQEFFSPESAITASMLKDISASNEKFLSLAFMLQEHLGSLCEKPPQDTLYNELRTRLGPLRDRTPKPSPAELEALFLTIFEEHLAKKARGKSEG